MAQRFDLLILGTGPAASRIASACAGKLRVAMVDAREFGGTCALRGCNPKKVFTRAAELADWNRRSQGQLISFSKSQIDWRQLVDFKRTFTDPVPEKSAAGYREQGIALFHGTARFTGRQSIDVAGQELAAETIVICTGAEPVKLNLDGEQHLTQSDQFMELDALPRRIVFLGGGYISFEFAHVAHRADAEVTVLELEPRPLAGFEGDLVEKLVAYSRELGLAIQTRTEVQRIVAQSDGSLEVVARGQDGGEQSLRADMVVHGGGRVPALEALNLAAADIEAGDNGVKVNDYLQCMTNPHVYAAGDAADTPQPKLSPVANQQGRTVAANILEGNRHKPDYGVVPRVVFTVPELASIGLTEDEASERSLKFKVQQDEMTDWTSIRKLGGPVAAYKVLIDQETDRLLGAHLLGPGAAETINLFALAIKFELTASQLKSVLFAFPTHAADVRTML
jgi:glutathione reductase (NADPH)